MDMTEAHPNKCHLSESEKNENEHDTQYQAPRKEIWNGNETTSTHQPFSGVISTLSLTQLSHSICVADNSVNKILIGKQTAYFQSPYTA